MNFQPKMIFLEDASYGGKSYIIKCAKEEGIKTAELQHGFILKNHLAYNYGDAVFNSTYSNFLPDYILTFGDYWNSNIRSTSKCVTIGYPYLEESFIKLNRGSKKNRNKDTILFVSSGKLPLVLMNIVAELYNIINRDRYDLYFRPHPLEIAMVESLYKDILENNVILDQKNIYESLYQKDIIISAELSTVLFEAIYFTNRIFLLNHPINKLYLQEEIFCVFNSTQELKRMIDDGNTIHTKAENLWEKNWRSKYRSFIENILNY